MKENNQLCSFSSLTKFEVISGNILYYYEAGNIFQSKIAWLNQRWFLESGVDACDLAINQQLQAWLLSTFAVSPIKSVCQPGTFGAKQLGADRYGGTQGTLHGGSGRCGSDGQFNAKGVGPTPLVAGNVDWAHSHGCLFLYDAIREVISSEILNAETPRGAIPIIAIIDAGFSLAPAPGAEPEPCAIIVRPNFLRAAHFERSVFFGSAGFPGSDQHLDSQRVRDIIRYADETLATPGSPHKGFDLSALFDAFADQVAACRAHRLWAGRPTMDNLTVKGEFLDFGGFRALPNWKAADDNHGQIFGQDLRDFGSAAESLVHFFRKYSAYGASVTHPKTLTMAVRDRIDASFKTACAAACGFSADSATGRALSDLLLTYFRHQQQSRYCLDSPSSQWRRKDWLFDQLAPPHAQGGIGARLSALLRTPEEENAPGPARWAAARRWLTPRPLQYYHVSKSRTRRLVRHLARTDGPVSLVQGFIADEVALSRRVWPEVEPAQMILGFVTDITSSALFTYDSSSRTYLVILTGAKVDGGLHLFGQRLRSVDDAGDIRHAVAPGSLSAPQTLSLSGQALTIPAAKAVYPEAILAAAALHEGRDHG